MVGIKGFGCAELNLLGFGLGYISCLELLPCVACEKEKILQKIPAEQTLSLSFFFFFSFSSFFSIFLILHASETTFYCIAYQDTLDFLFLVLPLFKFICFLKWHLQS